ncbi:HTH_38 domain-containing protein [Trichonephila clavipes]|nr:HTH_38 domain-containing protein [Trichonephila clavipes]
MSRRKQRSAFDQVSEFDRGRIVAYRYCGLSFRKIGSRVGRNQTTVMRIGDRWMQEGTTDWHGRSHPLQCTTSHEDRQIVRMAVTDRSVTSRTVEQHIESNASFSVCAYYSTPFTAEWSVRKTSFAWSTLDTDVSATNGAMKEGCGRQNGMKMSLLMSHVSVCNTTMVGFESGDTVETGC